MYTCNQNTITVFDYSRNKFKLILLRCDKTRENNFKVFERKRKYQKKATKRYKLFARAHIIGSLIEFLYFIYS